MSKIVNINSTSTKEEQLKGLITSIQQVKDSLVNILDEYEYYGEENCRKYWLYDIKSKILEKQGKNDEAAEYRRWSEEEYKKYIQSRET